MSPGEVLRAFMEDVWNARRIDRFPHYVSPAVKFHPPRGEPRNYEQYLAGSRDFQSAFSDLHFETQRIIEDDDLAAARIVITGTHDGAFRGHPATRKPVRVGGRPWARVADEKIVEFWQHFDEYGMFEQLGLPSPPRV